MAGTLAAVRLPEPFLTLADARRYLPGGALLIKSVAARPGGIVCRFGLRVSINGRSVARAKINDAIGRPLPRWNGCARLNADHAVLLSTDPDSFDSRYFGPIDRRQILGTALPVWVGGSR
jgi:type IV secretory pathway protease TraF